MLDIPYTSCDVLGGSIGQDKAVMKDIFKANNIPMVDYFVVYNKTVFFHFDGTNLCKVAIPPKFFCKKMQDFAKKSYHSCKKGHFYEQI